MSGKQPVEGGGYTEIQAGPPAHAPAPQISAVSTLHNPFFVTGLVGGDEQTSSSVPSSLPWPSPPTAAEDTASLQCPLLRFYPDPTDETDSMLPALSFIHDHAKEKKLALRCWMQQCATTCMWSP